MTVRTLPTGWTTEATASVVVVGVSMSLWFHLWWSVPTAIVGVGLGLFLPRSLAVTTGGLLATAISLGAYLFLDLTANEFLNWIVLVLISGMLPFMVTRAWMLRREALRTADSLVRVRAAGRAAEVEHAHSEEKRRIAEELHDDLGHQLSLASLQISALSVDPELTEEQRRSLTEIHRRLGTSVSTLARTVRVLRSDETAPRRPHRVAPTPTSAAEVAEGTGAVADQDSVGQILAEAGASGAPVRVSAPDRARLDRLPHTSVAGRFLKEALTNALRHAPGESVHVTVTDTDGRLRISVRNRVLSGRADVSSAGTGIGSLQRTVAEAGGSCRRAVSEGIHELALDLPMTAVCASAEADCEPSSPATEPELFLDPGPVYASARTHGNRRFVLAVCVPFVLLALVIGIVIGVNWWQAERSLIAAENHDDLVIGMSETSAKSLLPEHEADLSEDQLRIVVAGSPQDSHCHYYSATSNILADASGDVIRVCFESGRLIAMDTLRSSR